MQNDANLMVLANHYYFKNESGITYFLTISKDLGEGLILNIFIFKTSQGFAQKVDKAHLDFSQD